MADNPSDYLVVEDEKKPSTWHLPVKKNGTPDHTLMGAAWAALHEGYRGNTYDGPGKTEAIAKLTALYKSEKMPVPGSATKAGARHSRSDLDLINTTKAQAQGIVANMDELGAEEAKEPDNQEAAAKSAEAPEGTTVLIYGAVKAAGEDELDVLYMPYGGPNNGKDSHGEYFDEATKEHADRYPDPLVLHYHGSDENGRPQGDPENIGKVIKRWADEKGRWVRVVLDMTKDAARKMLDAARRNVARVSSGSIAHLTRVERNGHISNWPVVEISLMEAAGKRQPANQYAVALPAMKSHYQIAGKTLPEFTDDEAEPQATGAASAAERSEGVPSQHSTKGILNMEEKDVSKLVQDGIAAALKARDEAEAAKAAEAAKFQEAVKAEVKKQTEAAVKSRRLPDGAPYVAKFPEVSRYDSLEARDIAFMIDILKDSKKPAAPAAVKALALRMESKEATDGTSLIGGVKCDNREIYADALKEYSNSGIKANELDNTAQSGFGSDFIGTAYSQNLWLMIRQDVGIGSKLMASAIEVPQGFSSIYLPLEGADPTWYLVAETTANNATTGIPDSSVTASKVATAVKQLTVGKMGGRVVWSGEMDEDSLIPFAANLRRQMEMSCLEQFTHLVIDGDTATGATTNINCIGGTPVATDLYLLLNGFRKSPLITTTACSRSAAGSFVAEDFLSTIKLLGPAGINALINPAQVAFIIDVNTNWKALTLPEVKTRDVSVQATIDTGKLTSIYGYQVIASAFMHWRSTTLATARRANTAGKVDTTTQANNTTGAILAVRFDQWQLGFKRKVSIETQRIPQADATQIVALMRVGMVQRDTYASAISYNVGLS